MSKILVAGGIEREGDDGNVQARFSAALGRNIILRGHTLLGGCRTSLDAHVATAAAGAAVQKGVESRRLVRSWVTTSTKPAHSHGELVRSQLNDWSQIPRGFVFPEPIQEADAVIIVGGWEG